MQTKLVRMLECGVAEEESHTIWYTSRAMIFYKGLEAKPPCFSSWWSWISTLHLHQMMTCFKPSIWKCMLVNTTARINPQNKPDKSVVIAIILRIAVRLASRACLFSLSICTEKPETTPVRPETHVVPRILLSKTLHCLSFKVQQIANFLTRFSAPRHKTYQTLHTNFTRMYLCVPTSRPQASRINMSIVNTKETAM